MKERVNCKPKEYATSTARLLLGDDVKLDKMADEENAKILKRDFKLVRGYNKVTRSDIIHWAIECVEKHGLHPTPTLSDFVGVS